MNDLIVADKAVLPVFTFAPNAIAARDDALSTAALIGTIKNQEQNDVAVRAGMGLKAIANQVEKARKTLKEPLIEAGRQLDRTCATFLAEVEREAGRISNLAKDFQLAEQMRIREEQEAQQRELDRIERERQAEIQRIAREQAEAERKAQEAAALAERMAAEATNKKAAAAAEAARIEAIRLTKEAAAKSAAQFQQAEETAQAARFAENKPIVAQRTTGQAVRTDWEISLTNPILFAKQNPDCVNWDKLPINLTQIKEHLNNGRVLQGIRAEKKVTVGFRPTSQNAIEV